MVGLWLTSSPCPIRKMQLPRGYSSKCPCGNVSPTQLSSEALRGSQKFWYQMILIPLMIKEQTNKPVPAADPGGKLPSVTSNPGQNASKGVSWNPPFLGMLPGVLREGVEQADLALKCFCETTGTFTLRFLR